MTMQLASITRTVAANAVDDLTITGSFLACTAANLGSFSIQLDHGPSAAWAQGLKYKAPASQGFSVLTVDNSANSSALTVTFLYGNGEVFDQRQLNNSSLTQTLQSDADVAVAAASTQQVLPVNNNRVYALVANPLANPLPIRVGDVNVGAARGLEVVPGDSVRLETVSAIYVYNPHTAAMSVALLEVL